jgi:hypothetical protein
LEEKGVFSLPLTSFRGNRFNVLFENAAGVFFMKNEIMDFLQGNASNQLLKSVAFDISTPEYLAGCKALGLVSFLITLPLWTIIESKCHILDIGRHYHELIIYIKDASLNVPSFMRGEMTPPYAAYAEGSCPTGPIYSSLICPWEHDSSVECILTIMLPSMLKVLEDIFEDHLPGVKWTELRTDQEIRGKTRGKV